MEKGCFSRILLFCGLLTTLSGCNNDNVVVDKHDGEQFDISLNQDKSLTATLKKANNTYELLVSGEGSALDYKKSTDVPWYFISKMISKVNIDNGINNIGDYFFYSLPLEYIFIPESVSEIAANSFNAKTIIYSFAKNVNNEGKNEVYYYRESKPETPGNYFYLDENEEPHLYIFDVVNVLFIGNSFTFRDGTPDNPAVPNYFKQIAANFNIDTNIDYVLKGSHSLTKFADVNDEMGLIVEEKLTSNNYDYIILQEQSTTPLTNYNLFLDAVIKLKKRILETQPSAKTYLYETWGSPKGIEGTEYTTTSEMELALRNAYLEAASESDSSVTLVGKAFAYAYETLGINVYAEDERHQSGLGAYYSAACHVRAIFKVNVAKCDYFASFPTQTCLTLLEAVDYII
jgi:hypothetical protein